ncbi:hypothetical protein Pmar_PMAR010047 [Perkinsus marinus ATCC 50983]|uniref:Uncharacterized protein n=1 Tax=Perkinsus marinus (strain ATCC 50983 / TXsc) TaxID=423536 RepID=C5K4P1_PERM5|nr:hypothetical protein Pmar_PMAR010047 [Perkinsus marinus ATCC 50983]EER20313.1 hypothetical protein Pmar_PMAR010047 [Perkinsus marinus ATCC 50983]|eukprot:XP_002788517.1 hypothetical protein Pmar_PMAR010047 [Perkinsus marinus ATCC 50983]
MSGGQLKVDGPLKNGGPQELHIDDAEQIDPDCSLSYFEGASYKTIWFSVTDGKVHPVAWRCPANHLTGDIKEVERLPVPPGVYNSVLDKCIAGVRQYSNIFGNPKPFLKEQYMVKAICKHR